MKKTRRVAGAPVAPLRERVLELLTEFGKPVGVREIVRRLDLVADGRRELKGALREMIAAGEIVKVHGARVGLPSRMNLVVGRLTCNPGGFGFVVPEKKAPREADIYVSAINMKEALHGDRVVARVERHTPKGAEGRIIRILERATQRIVGRFESDGRFGGHVVPFDRRVLHELFVQGDETGGAESGQMVLAEITRPPTATRNPAGRVLAILGRLEEKGVDLKVVMAKYGLPDAFPEEVEAEATAVPTEVRAQDTAGRTDFRNWDTVTVDPETARDHDDAISLDRLPERVAAGRAHRRRRALRAARLRPRPGGLPPRDVGVLPRPRGADAAARAVQQHLQPGREPGPPDPDGGHRARQDAARSARPSSTTASSRAGRR